MSEEPTQIAEQEVLIEDTQSESIPKNDGIIEEPQAELSPLDSAIQERMGHFEINISPADLKYVKNLLNNKIEWKGPNESYLMLMALLSISSELKERNSSSTERVKIHLPSATIESINFFLNRVTGKGEESAHRLFAISMLFRPAIEKINKLDAFIKSLESEEK